MEPKKHMTNAICVDTSKKAWFIEVATCALFTKFTFWNQVKS